MGKTNRAWHEHNRMPVRASMEQRIAWHREHVENCGCRPVPRGVIDAMKARGMRVSSAQLHRHAQP